MSKVGEYLTALQAACPVETVTDQDLREAYISGNYSRMPVAVPAAVCYPKSTEQVQKIVELANEYHIPLTVRSSGGNESMNGTSFPAEGQECVTVNLSKMNRIINIDPQNNMAIIEAGVTYGQLNEALKPYGLYMEHPLAPRAEKSVLSSLVDRDPVMTAKHLWDVPDPLCAVEMVMGKGRVFRSGSAAGPGTLEEMLAAGCGINQAQGPVWLDLARVITGSQGTLAIVTWASVKVRPIGTEYSLTYVQSDDIDCLAAYVSDVIRRRLGEEAVLLNRKGMEIMFGMEKEEANAMPEWTYLSSVRGFRYFPLMYQENQILDMQDLAQGHGLTLKYQICGLDNGKVKNVLENPSPAGDFWKLRGGQDVFDLFLLNTMDQIGFYSTLAKKAAEHCGLNPNELCIYAQPSQMGRNCHIEFLISANQEKADELEQNLGMALLDNKGFFSRPYGKLVDEVYERYTDQRKYMPVIKEFFDENRIMNPGRLVYGERRTENVTYGL